MEHKTQLRASIFCHSRNPAETGCNKKLRHQSRIIRYFLLLEGEQYGALSDFQYHAIFSSEFSVLPQKSSEYLRADSSSDANSRILSSIHKTLNVNNLYSRVIFPSCNKHRFSMRYSPYQGLKRTTSRPDTGEIRPSNGHYQNVKRTIPDCAPEYTKRQYSLKWPK